ncbi:hypothetical protein [Parasphingorhabdus pacifica]
MVEANPATAAGFGAAMSMTPGMGGIAAGMAQVSTYVNTGGTAQQASFSVDLDQAPGLLASYKDAREQLSKIATKAARLQLIGSPGDDEVSKKLVKDLGKMASSEPGCLLEAVNDGIKRLNEQIEQLENAINDYQAADENAKPTQV